MMRPLPRSTMCASAAWDRKKVPERLTSSTLCQSSSVSLSTVLSMVMPALLTRMSSLPCCSMTSPITRRQSSAEPTLPWWMVTGVRKRSAKSAANCSAASTLPLNPAAMTAPWLARLRDGGADAAGAAGDEGDAAAQSATGFSRGRLVWIQW